MLLVAIQDTISKVFLAPFIEHNDETAKRTFKVLTREPGMISKNPQDFQLFKVGEFDQATGKVSSCDHVLLISGQEVQD